MQKFMKSSEIIKRTFSIKKSGCYLIPFDLHMFKYSPAFNSFKILNENGKSVKFKILLKKVPGKNYKRVILKLYDRYKTATLIYSHIVKKEEEILFLDQFNLPKSLVQINFNKKELPIKSISISTGNKISKLNKILTPHFEIRNYRLFIFCNNLRGKFLKIKIKFNEIPSPPIYCKIYYPLTYIFVPQIAKGNYLLEYGKGIKEKPSIISLEKIPDCKVISIQHNFHHKYSKSVRQVLFMLILLGGLIFIKLTLDILKNSNRERKK